MSLVTRCPACATPFTVVKDQLRVSDGWVRCGRCSQVFDATLDLHDAADLAPEPPIQPPLAEVPQPQPEQIPSEDAETDFLDDDQESLNAERLPASTEPEPVESAPFDDGDEPLSSPPAAAQAPDVVWPDADILSFDDEGRTATRPPVPPPLSFPDIDLSLNSRSAAPAVIPEVAPATNGTGTAAVDAAFDEVSNIQLQKALRRARAKSAKIAKAKMREQKEKAAQLDAAPVVLAASEPEADAPAAISAPPFFVDEKASTFARRPAARRSMAVLVFVGVLLLAGQMAYQERDVIVARQPSLRPAMESMCQVLRCEVSALRQINDIKVDGASFSRAKSDDGYQLSFTLRNSAEVPLAMPAVELSLLDTQERAIVRRVLMPTDFGAPTVLPARSERSASLSLKLTGPEAALMPPVVGFRVETLYP